MRITELKKELQDVLDSQLKIPQGFGEEDNPQIIQTRITAENRAEILQSILDRINGDRIALSFYK